MDAPFPEYSTSLLKKIRKCRKKLRQIEGLEVLKRPLSAEEQDKVLKRVDIRAELLYLISEYESNTGQSQNQTQDTSKDSVTEDDDMKRTHSDNDTESIGKEDNEDCETELIQFSENVTAEKVPRLEPTATIPEATTKNVKDADVNVQPNEQKKSSPHPEKLPKPSMQDKIPKVKGKPKQKLWKETSFSKTPLEGHSDLVLSVDCDYKYIISSSRDTTVKIWNSSNGEEVNSLRGHTGAVSAVILLSEAESRHYLCELPIPPEAKTHRLAITGATDCSVRVWSLISGNMYKSIYTYNGVSAIAYISSLRAILSGTDGGKLELWDAVTGYNYQSLHVAEEEIKCLKVLDDKIFCGTSDCILSVYTIQDKKLSVLFTTELEFNTTPHNLMSLSVYFEEMCCGDDHPNLKIVTWKSGRAEVTKYRNVKSGYGTTDATCIHKEILISSSFDLDTGDVSLNVRKLPSFDYLYSLSNMNEKVGRILCISAFEDQKSSVRFVTGGQSLNVWELRPNNEICKENAEEPSIYQNVTYERELAKPAIDSDDESEPDRNESDEDENSSEDSEEAPTNNEILYESAQQYWYDRWCTIL